ncbi:inactive cytochrome P450 76AD1-like [Beta vulgaris subsp. vulgaris]|uniref:inactive cytochrome P450 76AD1-like n=1 Tax=Beta vulgaris subsp. vulgaris TaxID=3555 RepID=UPI002036E352|nr:inactive cytochrome P450 76AD1-like [Beta vulgaris subsp. vulgaris]
MDYYTTLFLILLPIFFALLYFYVFKLNPTFTTNNNARLPPGPKPIPILGNLPHLGDKPHHSLANLAKTYGPLMSLKFGSISTIVVSSSIVAKEMFQKHDLTLSSRHVSAAVRANGHDKFSMAWLPVGPKWRALRKISTIHLFSSQRLDSSQALKQEKVSKLIDYAKECCNLLLNPGCACHYESFLLRKGYLA